MIKILLIIIFLAVGCQSMRKDDIKHEESKQSCTENRLNMLEDKLRNLEVQIKEVNRDRKDRGVIYKIGRSGEILSIPITDVIIDDIIKNLPYSPYLVIPRIDAPIIEGEVKNLSTSQNIVIINRGTEDGVQQGYTFKIYRGNEYAGIIVIEKVYPKESRGIVLVMTQKSEIYVGDRIITLSKP